MDGRRPDVSTESVNPLVRHRRGAFDQHLDECQICQPALCPVADRLWRNVCIAALRAQQPKDGS